jgi:5-formyltetrahydrofolate cyclo-ligase
MHTEMTAGTSKAALRTKVAANLKNLAPEHRSAESARARALLEKQSLWKNARTILVYAPLPEEVDVWPLVKTALAERKTICLPRFDAVAMKYVACRIENPGEDLVKGRFGIREPVDRCALVSLNRLDLVLVPGVAFDLHGRRLGRGKGFYDRLLALMQGTTCGVAFDEQIVEEVPVEPHDVPLNCILTPTRWLEFQR